MSSVKSILIKTCMSTIQKEMQQLEHWLQHLPEDSRPLSPETTPYDPSDIYARLEAMSQAIQSQQITLTHLMNRMESLESVREIHIQPQILLDNEAEEIVADEWMGDPIQDAVNEVIYHVNKEDVKEDEKEDPKPEAKPIVKEEPKKEEPKPVVKEEPKKEEPKPEVKPVGKEEPKKEEPKPEVKPVVKEEPKKEEPKPEVKPVVKEEPKKEESEAEEEAEVEEEEEAMELEEIEYKGVAYYRDSDNLIYTIEEDEQPSDMAVGIWKEKTQAIVFYKKK